MGHYKLGSLRPVILDPDLTFMEPRTRQQQRAPRRILRDLTQSLRVLCSLYLVQRLKTRETVDDDLVEQNDDDLIVSELDSSDLGSKRQVPEATGLVVVPNHDLVGRGDRVGSTSDYGEDLGAVEHPDQSDPATEFAAEGLAEWVAFVNAEADVGAGGEAAMVLVEGEVEDGGRV